MHTKTLTELSAALAGKHISSVELTTGYLQRIERFEPTLNSFITICQEQALTAAKAADVAIANGTAGPLTGIPIVQKDIFCTDGIKTSCGSKMLDNFIAPYDATVVTKCNQAGMVLLGKANMDEFAMGSSNENSFYGAVKNPWDIDRVPGGSSGGSAAIVAARLSPIATATDTGGSIRQPASFCGITGFKPTYGRVSRFGMIAFASSMDQAGLMAPCAQDIALTMNAIAGFDPRDSTSSQLALPDYTANLNQDLTGKVIGLPKEFFASLDGSVADLVMKGAKQLEALGAQLVEITLPHVHLSVPVYYVIAPAECSANLARFDGVRFGHRCANPVDLLDLYRRSRAEGFGAEVKRRIMVGTHVLSAGCYEEYYVKAQRVRRLISNDFHQAFQTVDAILGPTSPGTAFKLGEKAADPVSMYLSDIYTIAANLAGLPSLSMPTGFINGLPVGLQLTGKNFDDATLLNIAHRYQQVTNWHKAIPENFA
jgi:aspartyl-tRNA(Asn)/glutamyl-tRNA(Gln) amidotransferase subunit A